MIHLEYGIVEPDDVVEASFSSSPADRSTATIRIVATVVDVEPSNVGAASDSRPLQGLRYVEISVPPELCSEPGAVTPQVGRPQDWRIEHRGAGVFRATPTWTAEPKPETTWHFILHGVPISEGEGTAGITVVQFRSTDPEVEPTADGPVGPLQVRKIEPRLRIDVFRPIDTQGEIAPSVDRTEAIWLEWATTGATKVTLIGPDGMDELVTPDRLDPVGPRLPLNTTGTYTLVAERPGAQVVAQLTITLKDHMVVSRLIVNGEVVEDLHITDALTVENLVAHPGGSKVTVDEDLSVAGTLTVGYLNSSSPGAPSISVDGDLTVEQELTVPFIQPPPPPTTGDPAAEAADLPPPSVSIGDGSGNLTFHGPLWVGGLDVDQVNGPLRIRSWQGGSMQPTLRIGSWSFEPRRDSLVLRMVGGRYEFRPGGERERPQVTWRSDR